MSTKRQKFTRILLLLIFTLPLLASSPLSVVTAVSSEFIPINTINDYSRLESSLAEEISRQADQEPPPTITEDNVGFYVPSKYRWYFKTNRVDGWSGVITMGWGGASELKPVVGDWDGDGMDTAGFYKPSQYKWFIKNNQNDGWAGVTSINWGGAANLTPIAGDWDGDGDDTLGFYNPSTGEWFLKDENTAGWSGFTKVVWGGAAGNQPVVGDWDGNGTDTIGFFVPSQNKWWLKNSLADGWTGVSGFSFGTAETMDPVTGDWNANGTDTVGGYTSAKWRWYLKDDQVSGWSNVSFLRFSPTLPYTALAGKWESGQGPTCYILTRLYSPVGSGSAPTASPTASSGCPQGQYTAGQGIIMTAHPAAGWTLDYWIGTNPGLPTLTMPSSNKTVTAVHEATPTTLRIINDLQHASGWDQYNSLLWIKTSANCGDPAPSWTEHLWPYETASEAEDTLRLAPIYNSTGSYIDIDVSGIPLAPDGSYCIFIQAGWWDSINSVFPPFDFLYYQKTPTNCYCCDGVSTCEKWSYIQIIKPYGDPEIIYVDDYLPDYHWSGTSFCP